MMKVLIPDYQVPSILFQLERSRYSSLIAQGCHGINQLYYKIGIHRYESDYWYSVATVLGQALQHPSLQWIDPHVDFLPDKGLRYLRLLLHMLPYGMDYIIPLICRLADMDPTCSL